MIEGYPSNQRFDIIQTSKIKKKLAFAQQNHSKTRLPNAYPSKCLPTKFNTISKILVHKNGVVCINLLGKH